MAKKNRGRPKKKAEEKVQEEGLGEAHEAECCTTDTGYKVRFTGEAAKEWERLGWLCVRCNAIVSPDIVVCPVCYDNME